MNNHQVKLVKNPHKPKGVYFMKSINIKIDGKWVEMRTETFVTATDEEAITHQHCYVQHTVPSLEAAIKKIIDKYSIEQIKAGKTVDQAAEDFWKQLH